jgi:hypothetical protein
MSRVAIISYHSNIESIYADKWIEEYKQSILGQTLEADIIEMNYGGGGYFVFGQLATQKRSATLPSFVDAMNTLITMCFEAGYDYVLNSNADDSYHKDWAAKTVRYLEHGFDIVSSNFALINERSEEIKRHQFHNLNIKSEILKGHNIICHPSVGYSKKFWEGNRYDPNEIPFEDLKLWQRSIGKYQFIILEDCLCFHRTHSNAVSYSKQRA